MKMEYRAQYQTPRGKWYDCDYSIYEDEDSAFDACHQYILKHEGQKYRRAVKVRVLSREVSDWGTHAEGTVMEDENNDEV